MKMNLNHPTTALLFALALGACAGPQTREDRSIADASPREAYTYPQTKAFGDSRYLSSDTIAFDQNSAYLTTAARQQLRELVASAQARGNIRDIKVSVWSDSEFPGNQKDMALSQVDKNLADRRAASVEDFLEDTLNTHSVETFSMAEKANWMARLFNTDDAELKSSLALKSYEISEAQLDLLRKGRATQAVIVIQTEMR